ncbi:hypothetical protein ACSBR2_002605 [Camellia fascicularis]
MNGIKSVLPQKRLPTPTRPEHIPRDLNGNLSPDTVVCCGGSAIISPSGTILAGPNFQGESLISADLDLGEILQAKLEFSGIGCNMGRTTCPTKSGGPDLHEVKTVVDNVLTSND